MRTLTKVLALMVGAALWMLAIARTTQEKPNIQPLRWGGQERAEYTVGVSGCERRTTCVVVCALGSPSCFAAAAH
jgi:hypothetical protein